VGTNGADRGPLVLFNLGLNSARLQLLLSYSSNLKLRAKPFLSIAGAACSVLVALLGSYWFVQRVCFRRNQAFEIGGPLGWRANGHMIVDEVTQEFWNLHHPPRNRVHDMRKDAHAMFLLIDDGGDFTRCERAFCCPGKDSILSFKAQSSAAHPRRAVTRLLLWA